MRESDKKRFLVSIVISVLILVFAYAAGINFLEPDDYLIAGIMGGAYGKGIYQILTTPYISTVLTGVLYLLQSVTHIFHIYPIFLLLLFCICFINLHYYLYMSKAEVYWSVCLYCLEIVFVFFITYTVVAYLLVGTSVIVMYGMNKYEKSLGGRLLFLISMILGIMLRRQVLVTGLFVVLPLVIDMFTKKKKDAVQVAVVSLSVFLIVSVTNGMMYGKNATWDSYVSWNEASTQFRDYVILPYGEYEEILSPEGWTENDLEMLTYWQYADRDIFSTEKMENVISQMSLEDRYELNPVKLISKMYANGGVLAFSLTVILFLIIFKSGNKRQGLNFLLAAGIVLAMILALYVRQRYVLRVGLPLFCIGVIQLLILNQERKLRMNLNNRYRLVLAAICGVPVVVFFAMMLKQGYRNTIRTNDAELAQYVASNSETTFIVNSSLANSLFAFTDIKDISKDIYYENVIKTGSWDTFTGRYYEQAERRGISDPDTIFLEFVNNEDVAYITKRADDLTRMEIFLEEHYLVSGCFIQEQESKTGAGIYRFEVE